MDCKWLPANHALFQCANICLALSYLAPDNLNGLLFLRFSLGAAGVFFMTWGWIILCSLDTLLWNAGFAILNFAHFIYILVRMFRPVILNHNHEEIFTKLFQPLGVKRFQYKPLEEDGCIMKLKSGEIYAQEDKTKLERISVIMRGSVQVSKEGFELHTQKPYEFMDSPEWVALSEDEDKDSIFGVTLTAMDDVMCMTWKVEALRKKLNKDKVLKNIFDSMIGRDVTKKLFEVSFKLPSSKGERLPRSGSCVYLRSSESIERVHAVRFSEQVLVQNGATCQNSTVATTATVTATRTLIESLRREENDVTLRVRSSPTNSDIPRSPKRMELFHFNPELVAHHVAGSLKEQKLLLLDGEIRGSSLPRGPASELSNSDCSIGDLTHHFSYPVNEDVPLTSSEIRETII